MIIFLKDEKEIEGFRKAGKIAGLVLQKVLSEVKPGITTNQLDMIARNECKKHSVVPTFLGHEGFPAALCTSVNNIMVHGIPNNDPLVEGDLLSMDLGVTMDGFIGDTAETVIVGHHIYNILTQHGLLVSCCRHALQNAINVSVAGNTLNDIGHEISKVARKNKISIPAGYGGHGIGKNRLHDAPFVSNVPDEECSVRLRPGMVFAIEPMFISSKDNTTSIAKDKWGVEARGLTSHCEHTILITDGDPVVLTERSVNE